MKPYKALALSVVLLSGSLALSGSVQARGGPRGGGGAPGPSPQEQQFRMQQQQSRASQEDALRAQEAAARQAQQQAMRAQQEQARQAQDAMRQQQQQAREAQQEQQRQAQDMQRQQEQQAREAQQEQQRQAQDMQRQQEQQAREAQQQQQRQAQQQQQRQAQEMQKQQEQQAREAQQEQSRQQQEARVQQQEQPRGERPSNIANQTATMPPGTVAGGRSFFRSAQPRQLPPSQVPLNKAISMPAFDQSATAEEQQHGAAIQRNLQAHLYALPKNQTPPNFQQFRGQAFSNYLNNYNTVLNNQPLIINRQNTFINPVPSYEYPAWWQPQSGWQFANGFVLGNAIRVGLDWLRWGWHPYFGPPPEGFLCAADFVPTPWVYFPAYGLWREAGVMGWAPSGPPYDYTGPITVETLEPRHIHSTDPYTNWDHTQVVNVICLYDAYYYPDYERWGYMNRHGYFIWVNM